MRWEACSAGRRRGSAQIIDRARPRRGRLLRQRPARQRGGLPGRQAVQGLDRHQQHRLQQPALHGGGRGRLPDQPGHDGPPTCYADIDHADCLVVWGSNMAEAHPGHLRPRQGPPQGEPRRRADRRSIPGGRTPPSHATLHVPVAPGGDIALSTPSAGSCSSTVAVDEAFVAEHTDGLRGLSRFPAATRT